MAMEGWGIGVNEKRLEYLRVTLDVVVVMVIFFHLLAGGLLIV